ncbi:MAG: purine nucleoside permease [Acidiferrobacterales bacterium]|nr:purine nucleoside permease [Acidiferrobacterales bacterium]
MSKEADDSPIPVKAVIVTMFEIGEDEGDTAGEFQLWKERMDLDTRFAFPNSHHDIFMNEEKGVLGIVTGIGTAKSTAATMALGLDPRFDFSKAYWLIVGISGVDPEDASVGSAAWAEYLVDADLAHEIDAREIPDDWSTGYFARGSDGPNDTFVPEPAGEIWHLNADLMEWAFQLTKDMELPDFPSIIEARNQYVNYPNARKKPFVLKGDQLAGQTFWHGKYLNDWANDWVKYWSKGKGEFVTSAMEDTGSYQSLIYLDAIDKVDIDRLMVLRTASNYTIQPEGKTAAESLLQEKNEGYAGLEASLESGYLVGSKVINEILDNWDVYADQIPSVK